MVNQKKHLPLNKLIHAFEACKYNGQVTVYHLAEYLDLSEEFIDMAIKQYVAMGEMMR